MKNPEKTWLVPVAYYIEETGSRAVYPEIITVNADDDLMALEMAKTLLEQREADPDQPGYKIQVWHCSAMDFGPNPKYAYLGEVDEEGYVMGDPVTLNQLLKH